MSNDGFKKNIKIMKRFNGVIFFKKIIKNKLVKFKRNINYSHFFLVNKSWRYTYSLFLRFTIEIPTPNTQKRNIHKGM